MRRPLAIDLCCGLGGWTEGLLAEGYAVVGIDIEKHEYGGQKYPGVLVLADVLTLHGSHFRGADLIVASPPCQFFSYTAMPWSKGKALAEKVRADPALMADKLAIFNACFRIQREASEAAGRHIPMVVENVRGARPWVGPSKAAFGSFHLWGDVPALMPATIKARKVPGFRFDGSGRSFQSASVALADTGTKQRGSGAAWFDKALDDKRREATAIKNGGDWFGPGANCSAQRRAGSKSTARKAASAMIAKIPLPLARHVARFYKPA